MGETQWLDDTEQRAWRAWIDASRRISALIDRQLRTDEGLTLDDYEVLVHLSEAPRRRLRASELATAVANSPSRLTQRIDRMAARGLVGRRPDPTDGRGTLVCLTDEGFARLAAAAPGHVAEVRRRFVDRLTPAELATLADLLPRLLED